MQENRSKSIYVRVTQKEKERIERYAQKCGLSLSEYLRQRALKYQPKALLPDVFYRFNAQLEQLLEQSESNNFAAIEQRTLALLDEMTAALILPGKEAD